MRTFITIIISIFCFTMISCSDNYDALEGTDYYNTQSTRTAFADSAYVRIGMYGNIDGFEMKVSNMKVMSTDPNVMIPTFGNAIEEAEVLPKTLAQAVFDTKAGTYHGAIPSNAMEMILVRFDVEIISASHFDSRLKLDGVTCYILPENATWAEGGHYEYIINIDKDFLRLSAIEFDAKVEEFLSEI